MFKHTKSTKLNDVYESLDYKSDKDKIDRPESNNEEEESYLITFDFHYWLHKKEKSNGDNWLSRKVG